MASMSTTKPSSSSSNTRWKHGVFLSFYDQDTDKTFIDDLYATFKRKGILTWDDNELPRGNYFSEKLLKAVQKSTFAVIVISPNYAFSKWCLIELTEIMECMIKTGLTVLPIFYYVDPSDVRHQRHTFQEAFAKHERDPQVDMRTIQQWKASLTDVGFTAGWIVDGERHKSAVLQNIAARIWTQLINRTVPLVGIDSRVMKVMKKFDMGSNDVCFLGISGIGGIGKTILAKIIYDKVSLQFEASSFIISIREELRKHGVVSLQNHLISDIFMALEINMPDLDRGIDVLKNRLRNRKILIILDDVDAKTQLEALVGSSDWFGPGSRVVLTSRDDNLLRIHADDVYEIERLNNNEALELFSWSAFKRPHPDENYVALSKEFITYAQGNPLTLKVLGVSLSGRRTHIWKSDLDKLRVDPNKEILTNGKYRYDYCDENQNHKRYVEAIDFWVGILAFLLDFALLWVANSEVFERVVLVVSWIYCLATWIIFIWGARRSGARFAFPGRFLLRNQQPYGCTIDYVDKYAAIALVIFSTVQMSVKFSSEKFSHSALVLSGVIFGAKLGIEHQKSHSD